MSILDLPAADYHADQVADQPTLSASIAKLLITASPAHAKAAHPRLSPELQREEEPRFDLGNVCHSLLLQGLEAASVCDFPDWRTAAAREARDFARAHGLIPMLGHQWEEVEQMVKATREQIAALNVAPIPFTNGLPEQTIVWDEDGTACRARLDWLHTGYAFIDDLKTTSRSANPDAWSRRSLYDQGADLQAAAYLRGLKAVTGKTATWRWVVVETSPPYALSVITPTAAVLAIGEAKWEHALNLWRRCLETDTWPAYPPEVHYADLPAWIESAWLEREAREEIAA